MTRRPIRNTKAGFLGEDLPDEEATVCGPLNVGGQGGYIPGAQPPMQQNRDGRYGGNPQHQRHASPPAAPSRQPNRSAQRPQPANTVINEPAYDMGHYDPANQSMETISPGSLKASEVFGTPPSAIGHGFNSDPNIMHTMINMPNSQASAPARAPVQSTPNPQSFTQRHRAVSAMPHEEVNVDVIPIEAALSSSALVVQNEPDSEAAAMFRVLGNQITKPQGMHTAMITSAQRGDGKTRCAINLALAMSEYGRNNILLVEANLRNPMIAEMLGFTPASCFASQLKAHKTNPMGKWTISRISQWLHVMAVDPTLFSRSDVLDALSIELAIEHFKRMPYDYVLIDTPSVLGYADVPLIIDSVDGILLTAVSGETNGAAVRKATSMLAPAPILGIALLDG